MQERLAGSFVDAVGDAYRMSTEAIERLAPVLDTQLAAARAAWPGVHVSGPEFAVFLAERAPDDGEPAVALEAMRCADLYLACACATGAAGAAEAFERAILPAVPKAVARVDSDPAFVDEVVGLVRTKLLVGDAGRPPRIASYLGRGPLTAFAQVAALREAQSLKRRAAQDVHAELDVAPEVPASSADPELARLRDEVREPFRRAFADALSSLTPRERTVLRLYLVEDVSSEQIARMYNVHRATVARWVADAREAVLKGTRQRLMKDLGLGRASFDSLMGLVGSQLDVSLATFLGAPPQ
jgi:RNA polymerase sigma-70 factor (ECF subfamily)